MTAFGDLLDLPHWDAVVQHIRTWYRDPPSPRDGYSAAEIAQLEERLGFRLPARVREWNRLFGRRASLWSYDTPVTLEQAVERPSVAETWSIWEDPQGTIDWAIRRDDLTLDDPPVRADGGPWHASFSGFVTFLLLFDDLSYRDVEPHDLKPGVRGGRTRLGDQAAWERLRTQYRDKRIPCPDHGPEATHLFLEDDETLLLVDTGAAEVAAWAATAAAWERLRELAGSTPTQTWINDDRDPVPRRPPPDVELATVPDLAGLTPEAARSALPPGLHLSLEAAEHDASVPAGRVLRHAPPAGARVVVPEGIDGVRSLGPRERVVPDLTGLTEREARSTAGAVGFFVVAEGAPHPTAPIGQVLRQEPAPGTRQVGSGPLKVVSSLGPQRILLLDLAGLDTEQATARLGILGLEPGAIRRRPRSGAREGEVLETDPPPGTELPPGAQVDLVTG